MWRPFLFWETMKYKRFLFWKTFYVVSKVNMLIFMGDVFRNGKLSIISDFSC